jgi:hypothetical protein
MKPPDCCSSILVPSSFFIEGKLRGTSPEGEISTPRYLKWVK